MILDDYFARYNATFLHAKGERATNQLLDILNIEAEDKILEVGCGSGATLVKVASRHRFRQYEAVDVSIKMIYSAKRRLKFTRLFSLVSVNHIANNQLPFEDGTFSKVYVESVLGIQQGAKLADLLNEIFRVLKVNGKLVFNETIWTKNISSEEVNQFNGACLEHWGIIQANAKYPYVDDWRELLKDIGFKVNHVHEIVGVDRLRNRYELLSMLFTLKGKLKSMLNASGRKETSKLKNHTTIAPPNDEIMKGVIFEATK